MKYIQFKEDKYKKMSELSLDRKLYKLTIFTEEKDYKSFKVHQTFIKEANQGIYNKVIKRYKDDIMKLSEECNTNDESDTAEYLNITDEIYFSF